MELLFLNTWHGTLHEELREYLGGVRQNIDLFCFQEAHATEQSAYEDLFTDYERYYGEKVHEDLLLANVIFVRKGIQVKDSGTLFNEGRDIGFANYVIVEKDGIETAICNVHGIPHPGHKLDTSERLDQSQTLISHFKDKKRVIIGGDFNLLPETKSVTMFEEMGYRNLIDRYDIKSTRNHISLGAHPDNPQYFADYAFTSDSIDVLNFTVPSDIVSDHQSLRLRVASI